MGTRGAVGFKSGGQLLATYNHFDSYPSGLGESVVEFCHGLTEEDLRTLPEKIKALTIITDERGGTQAPTQEDIDWYRGLGWLDTNVSEQTANDWYCLLRGVQGAATLVEVNAGHLKHWLDGVNFLKDSLFCEYAYIVNLDNGTLEFYQGFNKEPDEKSPLPFPQEPDEEDGKYYPVRFVGCWPLEATVDDWKEMFYPDGEE